MWRQQRRVGGRRSERREFDDVAFDAGDAAVDDVATDANGDATTTEVGADAGCTTVEGTASVTIGAATAADEYALSLPAHALSATDWSAGNEALVLEVSGEKGLIGHLVLHRGADDFTYGMQLGALAAGETVQVKMSSLSSSSGKKAACVGPATLTPAKSLGAAAEGLINAPILKWPVKKRFDDLPMVLGWSKAKKHYELVYTNENGGTVALCGGGAKGMQAELARWGRGIDMEGMFNYGGATRSWERCTGSVGFDVTPPRLEGAHPVLYYGDGHNRLFESRGGYGQTCGTSSDKQADGDLTGWNASNPGNDEAHDAPYVVTLRPLPVALDAIDGYTASGGRREALLDRYAPWLYRILDAELRREAKIDGSHTFPMSNYLYADVRAADVGGSGDAYCALLGVKGGFKLRVKLKDGTVIDGPQMTSDYFGAQPGWKRIAIPLGTKTIATSDVAAFVFDAYDNDGIYFLSLGDAFIPRASGTNGATLDYVRKGVKDVNVYVDDGSSGCSGGVNTSGPVMSFAYPCVGGSYELKP